MVRKTVFSKEDVIQAGFRLVDRKGLEHLTARSVAEEMGASTAPVYSNFSNMEELEKALMDEAIKRLLKATRTEHTDNPFLNIGIGVLDFSREHPRWYESLFLFKTMKLDPGFNLMEGFLGIMAGDDQLSELDELERMVVLKKMSIFTHGLATEICSGRGDAHCREEWLFLLEEVGQAILKDALERTPRITSEIELLGSLWDCSKQSKLEKEED
jgi:AcrR family transcriptional regulator